MRKLLVVAAATLVAFGSVPAAHAAPPLTDFHLCAMFHIEDPQVEGHGTSVVYGGPILIGAQTGHLTCTVQVNAPTHADPDSCTVQGLDTAGSVSALGTCTYRWNEDDNLYLCTAVTIVSPVQEVWFWHSGSTSSFWTLDPAARCPLQSPVGGATIDRTWIDGVVCPLLKVVFRPEGDVTLPGAGTVWNCPPY